MKQGNDQDTIFALSSAAGRAGVAVFRLSGPQSRRALETVGPPLPAPRRAVLRRIGMAGGAIDRGLVLWLPGPGTFTGEDIAELHVHGSRAVIAALSDALANMDGLRPAEAGEFTRRAFENGRLDLTEAEGLADLINAETEAQRRQAVRQMEGALGTLYEGWRARAMRSLAHLEAVLDFSDEDDLPGDLMVAVAGEAAALNEEIAAHLADNRRGERLRDGVRIVIAGAPNAGKSTLMNALARRDVAIVSQRAGTTRDALEVHLDLGGYPVTLTDTAGLRESADEIEAEGVRRARAAVGRADLVVWLDAADQDAGEAPETGPGQRLLRVAAKADLARESAGKGLAVSALTGAGMDALIAALGAAAADLCGGGEDAAITRARHRAALVDARDALQRFAEKGQETRESELLAEELRLAARALGRITGKVDVEDLLGLIFADFCIGK